MLRTLSPRRSVWQIILCEFTVIMGKQNASIVEMLHIPAINVKYGREMKESATGATVYQSFD